MPPASIHSCARLIMLRHTRCNIVILIGNISHAVAAILPPPREGGEFFSGDTLKSTIFESNPHTIQELKDNISHRVVSTKITMLHRVYLNMVTARLLTNCSNTLRNIHTNARENITRTRAKQKAGYFFVAHPAVLTKILNTQFVSCPLTRPVVTAT